MLTSRQKEVLYAIVRLYNRSAEPIGSRTLLRESKLEVSPATIRNDMVVLEGKGLLKKMHTSSGRVPSLDAYRQYADVLIHHHPELDLKLSEADLQSIKALTQSNNYSIFQRALLAADLLASMTHYTVTVFDQAQHIHSFQDFKLVPLDSNSYIATLVTDQGRIENDVVTLNFSLSEENIEQINQLMNQELAGLKLDEAYQRVRLSIPLMIQRIVGYQIDFTNLISKALNHAKSHQYYVSGKHNIFNLLDVNTGIDAFKELLELVDGSNQLFNLMEQASPEMEVLFSQDFLEHEVPMTFIRQAYESQGEQVAIGLFGPSTMAYERVIPLVNRVINLLKAY